MLVDTSIWIDHLRGSDERLVPLLESNEVEIHPFVVGELASGRLARRAEILGLLRELRTLVPVEHHEALAFVARHRLFGRGLGWVNVHLLASARLASTEIWTGDKALRAAARQLGIGLFP